MMITGVGGEGDPILEQCTITEGTEQGLRVFSGGTGQLINCKIEYCLVRKVVLLIMMIS